jgi:hypothetical protein
VNLWIQTKLFLVRHSLKRLSVLRWYIVSTYSISLLCGRPDTKSAIFPKDYKTRYRKSYGDLSPFFFLEESNWFVMRVPRRSTRIRNRWKIGHPFHVVEGTQNESGLGIFDWEKCWDYLLPIIKQSDIQTILDEELRKTMVGRRIQYPKASPEKLEPWKFDRTGTWWKKIEKKIKASEPHVCEETTRLIEEKFEVKSHPLLGFYGQTKMVDGKVVDLETEWLLEIEARKSVYGPKPYTKAWYQAGGISKALAKWEMAVMEAAYPNSNWLYLAGGEIFPSDHDDLPSKTHIVVCNYDLGLVVDILDTFLKLKNADAVVELSNRQKKKRRTK